MRDPIVEELHRWRAAFARRHSFDLQAMVDEIKVHEKEHAERLSPLRPVRPRPVASVCEQAAPYLGTRPGGTDEP